jgi:hypothetical protein
MTYWGRYYREEIIPLLKRINNLWGSETRCSVLTWSFRMPVGRG